MKLKFYLYPNASILFLWMIYQSRKRGYPCSFGLNWAMAKIMISNTGGKINFTAI